MSKYPEARIVDFTHEIEAQNVLQAALILEAGYSFFPKGSVFVNVVDPGVGSERRILAAKTPCGIFLAPDNGLLTQVLQREGRYELRAVTNRRFFLERVSSTFHGRDCFAPAGALLAKDPRLFSAVGPRLKTFRTLRLPKPQVKKGKVRGEILFFDHFGNAFSNIDRTHLKSSEKKTQWQVRINGQEVGAIRNSYYEVKKGEPLALFSSSDILEIAVNQGSAREKLGLRSGGVIEVVSR